MAQDDGFADEHLVRWMCGGLSTVMMKGPLHYLILLSGKHSWANLALYHEWDSESSSLSIPSRINSRDESRDESSQSTET